MTKPKTKWQRFGLPLFLVILVFTAFLMTGWKNRQAWFGIDFFRVESVSMLPALKPNDIVIARLVSKKNFQLLENDIVVLINPNDDKQKLIKRLKYLPGQTAIYTHTETKLDLATRQPMVVRSQKTQRDIPGYFVIGDNLKHSTDSRDFGVVPKNQIIGKVIYITQF